MAFDYQGARSAGFSDAEIIEGVAQKYGTKFDTPAALKAGFSAEEIISGIESRAAPKAPTAQQEPIPGAALGQGLSNFLGGLGNTVEQYGGKGATSDWLQSKAAAVRPDNYDPNSSKLYTEKDGVQIGNAPRAFIENSPQLAATLAAYTGGSKLGGWRGGLLGAAGASLGLNLGNTTKEAADARTGVPNTPPEFQDKLRAVPTALASAVLDAVGARYFGGASGPIGAGVRGIANAGKQALVKTGVEAGTELAQDAVEQGGTKLFTEGGLRYDTERGINAGLTGGVVGGGFSAPKALSQTHAAIKNRQFGGDNTDVSTAVANDLRAASGGEVGSTKDAATAVRNLDVNYQGELGRAVSDARASGALQPDTDLDNAIARSSKGEAMNPVDLAAISRAPSEVQLLAQKITALNQLKGQNLGSPENFKGGLSTRLEKGVRAIANPVGYGAGAGAVALGLGAGGGAVLGTTALPALGAMAGGYGASLALDRLTGARNPVKRFTEQFADGNGPTRAAPTDAPPEAPIAPVDDSPLPWGPWNMPPAPQVGAFGKGARPPEAPPAPEAPQFDARSPEMKQALASLKMKMQMRADQEARDAPPPEAPPEAPFDGKLPKDLLAQLKARAAVMQMRDEQIAREAAENQPPPEAPEPQVDYEALGARMKLFAKMRGDEAKRATAEAKVAAKTPPIDDGLGIPAFLPNRQDIPAFLPNRQDIPAFLPNRGQQATLAPQGAPVDAAPPVGPEAGPVDVPAFLPKRVAPAASFPKPIAPTLAKITKANGKVKVKEKPAPVVTPEAPTEAAPTARSAYVPDVTKFKTFKEKPGDEAFPNHDKWDLSPEDFGKAIGEMRRAEGKFTSPEMEAGIARRVALKHKLAGDISAALPKFQRELLQSKLLAVDSIAKAEAYRANLLAQVKPVKMKAAILTAFNNEVIADIWKRKRKK